MRLALIPFQTNIGKEPEIYIFIHLKYFFYIGKDFMPSEMKVFIFGCLLAENGIVFFQKSNI